MSNNDSLSPGTIAACVVLCVPLLLLNAFALTQVWLWFVVPLGVQTLSMAHAYGIALTWALYCGATDLQLALDRKVGDTRSLDERAYLALAQGLLRPLVALFFGWVATLFM